ncbi:hypothetical protein ACS0TY_034581 [Phlomoides rotata]
MKMASLATYFGLGKQTHRSLDDVRMNLEVIKYCATVLFLESSLPDVFTYNSWVSPNATTRSRNNGKSPIEQTSSLPHRITGENVSTNEFMIPVVGNVKLPLTESNSARVNPYDMNGLAVGIEGPLPEDSMEEDKIVSTSLESATSDENSSGSNDFLEPDNISISSISVIAPFYRGLHRIQISHQGFPLQLQCVSLKVRFGISTKFLDHAGRPRLSFVVDAPPSLCKILDEIDSLAEKTAAADSGSLSEWRTLVSRKPGFFNYPTVRLHLPTVVDGEMSRWATEMYQKDSSVTQKVVFSRFDVTELESIFTPGNIIDAYFSVDTYDYQQNAGIRLVAKKVIVHSS